MSYWPILFKITDDWADQGSLRESTLVAVDECGETVSRLCTELLRGSETRTELRSVVVELTNLLERLDALDVSR